MLKRWDVWLTALGVGAMIHVDWHLGRPGHGSMSLGLSYHWLAAVPTVLLLVWLARARCAIAPTRAVTVVALLGLVLGQGLEPLGESVLFPEVGTAPLSNPVRWRVLGEFLTAGVATYIVLALLGRRQATGRRTG